jgi:hypothetical protein
MDGWSVLPPDAARIVSSGEANVLQVRRSKGYKNSKGTRIWKKVRIGDGVAIARLSVDAKAAVPNVPLDVHIVCQTSDHDGPTYGVLAAESAKTVLTSKWTKCGVVLDIPDGTQEIEFSIGVDMTSAKDAIVDIRSAEYRIESK